MIPGACFAKETYFVKRRCLISAAQVFQSLQVCTTYRTGPSSTANMPLKTSVLNNYNPPFANLTTVQELNDQKIPNERVKAD